MPQKMGKVIIALSCRVEFSVVLLLDSPGSNSGSSVLIFFTIYGFDACIHSITIRFRRNGDDDDELKLWKSILSHYTPYRNVQT